MHIVKQNDVEKPVCSGSEQECKNYLIVKARVFAGTDQVLYEKYLNSIVDDGVLETEKPFRNFKIIKHGK